VKGRTRQSKAGYRGNDRAGHEVRKDKKDKTGQGASARELKEIRENEVKIYGLLPLSLKYSTTLHCPLT
jgi:hypothetical protein